MSMEGKEDHLDIINYLYGEMNDEDRIRFEEKMELDDDLREEVNSLRETLAVVRETPDSREGELAASAIRFLPQRRHDPYKWARPLLAVAASVAILLLVGHYTQFSMRYGEGEFFIGFVENTSVNPPDRPEIEEMVREALEAQNALYKTERQQTLDSLQKFYVLLTQNEVHPAAEPKPASLVTKAELNRQMTEWQHDNVELLQKYLTAVHGQQQLYMQEALTQFSEFLQQQREEDLIMIRQNLIDLKDYQDQQKKETYEVLAGVLKSTNQPK